MNLPGIIGLIVLVCLFIWLLQKGEQYGVLPRWAVGVAAVLLAVWLLFGNHLNTGLHLR